jgi:hypothetical protein
MSRVLPSSRRPCRSIAPSAPPPSSCAPSCFLRPSNHPCPFPRPYRTFTCHSLSRRGSVAAEAEPPRSPPQVFTARQRRHVLHPNSGHPQALGEHMVVPHRFPSQERGRLSGIQPAPPPPHGQGPDCKTPNSSRVFSMN